MNKLSKDQKLLACQLYRSGSSSIQVADQLGVCKSTILLVLKKNGIARRPMNIAKRRNSINDSSFRVITDQSAYWIGFLMADGNVCGNRVELSLQLRDSRHVEKFQEFLQSSHKIGTKRDHGFEQTRLSVYSKQIVSDLDSYGVTPKKSLTAVVCDDLAMNRHFWRGVVDGDGYISRHKNSPRVGIVGSLGICSQFCSFVNRELGIITHPYYHKNIYQVDINGTKARDVLVLLYKDSSISLDRKHMSAQELFCYVDGRIR